MSWPDWEEIADGLALFQEHSPQSPEDWIAVARRCNAWEDFEIEKASPPFAALCIAVQEADRLAQELVSAPSPGESLT